LCISSFEAACTLSQQGYIQKVFSKALIMPSPSLKFGSLAAATVWVGALLFASPAIFAPSPPMPEVVNVSLCGGAAKEVVPPSLASLETEALSGDRVASYRVIDHRLDASQLTQSARWIDLALARQDWGLAMHYWHDMRARGSPLMCQQADEIATELIARIALGSDADVAYRRPLLQWVAQGSPCQRDRDETKVVTGTVQLVQAPVYTATLRSTCGA
jgi:hypothetical protein